MSSANTVFVTCIIQLLLVILAAGCASRPYFLNSQIAPAVTGANLGFSVKHFDARNNKGTLEIEVRAAQQESDYRSNFDLELTSAAVICAALTVSDVAFQFDWQEMELSLWNEYGNMFRWRNTVGFIKVRIQRQSLLMLRAGSVRIDEYLKYWSVLAGSKADAGLEMLEWEPEETGSGSGSERKQ